MPSIYHTSLQEYLSPEQIVLLEMLVRVIQIFKEIKIEKLAGRIPLPIKFESRRRAIQRFLIEKSLDLSLLWLPIIKQIVNQRISNQKHRQKKKDSNEQKKIYLAIDRTQWQEHNILILSEDQIFLLGDREFRGIHLAAWLTQLKIKYVFRIKEGTVVGNMPRLFRAERASLPEPKDCKTRS